jgi:hypothetical protein
MWRGCSLNKNEVNGMKNSLRLILILVLVFSLMPFMSVFPVLASDVTTSVTVTKLANDGTTVLDEVTVTVEEMMADSPELPVYGDGVTHYYFQGPSFDEDNMWDQTETVNVDSRDYGACKGNDVKDLCELAGGASAGSEIKIKSPDGFSKTFAYEDVYNPEPEQGKLIVTWYTKDAEESGDGYVTDGSYSTGMRLIFFAETLNPDGKHVFGNWDMHEYIAEKYWHYYYDGSTMWPSSSGLSVKWVSDIIIYSTEEPQPSPTSTPATTPTPTPTPHTTPSPSSTATTSPEPTFAPEIPEFPWGLILLLVITGVLISLIIYRKNTTKRKQSRSEKMRRQVMWKSL